MFDTPLVKIKKFNLVGEDERGMTSAFSLPRKQDEFIFITRKAGTISGNTYHEGKNAATNPKVFLLLSGEIIFSYRKIGENETSVNTILAPAMIEIHPYFTHQVEVIKDVVMIECNSIADIQNDRIKEQVSCVA